MTLCRLSGNISEADYSKETFTAKTRDIQSCPREQEHCVVAVGTTLDVMSQNLCSLQREKHNSGTIDTFTLLSPFPAKFICGVHGNNTNGTGNCAPAI